MFRYLALPTLATLLFAGVGTPAEKDKLDKAPERAKKEAVSYRIPYKMTIPKHIVVRCKINGKGPFNFILDTGAPTFHIATPVGKKAGLSPNADGLATLDALAIEGGVQMTKVKAHVDTPFQLEGMNGMGLAGMEIHGLMGYTVLAKFRMEIDFTKDKMTWTEVDYTPKLERIGGKGKGGQGGLELYGSLMKGLGGLLGRKATPPVMLRGFLGMTLEDGEETPVVKAVLEKGPAGLAGVRVDDLVTHVNGRGVTHATDVLRVLKNAEKVAAGSNVQLTIKRGQETKEIAFKSEEGI